MGRSKNGHTSLLLEVTSTSMTDYRPAEATIDEGEAIQPPDHSEDRPETVMQLSSPLAEAGRAIIQKQLQKLEKAQQGVEEQQDPEAIHDMRVASRRLRTALKILQTTVDDPKVTGYYRRGLHKLTDTLSQVRDTDVRIEHLEKYQATHPEQSDGLQPLAQSLHLERDQALMRLTKTLHKHKVQRLLHDLEQFAKKPGTGGPKFQKDPHEMLPSLVRHFVGSQVWQGYEAVLAYETALAAPVAVPIATLHRLRIAFKHLRYTLEFFQDALPDTAKGLVAQLSEMQDYLGDLHDHDVAVTESDQALANRDGDTSLRTYRDARASQRDQLQLNFLPKWAKINSPAFRQKLSGLLK